MASVLLSGCSQLSVQPEQLDPKIYYNHDLEMNINGVPAIGTYVAPITDAYAIRIEDRNEVDQVIISTCKRTEVLKKEEGGFFKRNKKGFTYVYVPGLIEKTAGCRLEISGLNLKSEKNAWGVIAFKHPNYKLNKVGISCNAGPDYSADGVAICESGKGQLMQIWFQQPVRVASKCAHDKEEGVSFQLKIQPRECTYVFETLSAPYERFHLTLLGAEQVLARGD